jgi:hypothetical protein
MEELLEETKRRNARMIVEGAEFGFIDIAEMYAERDRSFMRVGPLRSPSVNRGQAPVLRWPVSPSNFKGGSNDGGPPDSRSSGSDLSKGLKSFAKCVSIARKRPECVTLSNSAEGESVTVSSPISKSFTFTLCVDGRPTLTFSAQAFKEAREALQGDLAAQGLVLADIQWKTTV